MQRRRFLRSTGQAAAALAWPGWAQPRGVPSDLSQLDAAGLQAAMARGEASSAEALAALWARADRIDVAGPTLRAIVQRNPAAEAIARAMDHERSQGRLRGPLHGVPVLLKDNIDTGDELLTTAGSLALTGRPAAADAALVARLRAAGCVIAGKTNLSEWANFRGARSTSGWSARGGQTRNPHALDRSPSGSSAGSAAAVAASLGPLAVGTETDGSIVCPAAVCGVVGFKPTLGRISRRGIVPLAPSQDSAGPIARTVVDAALLYHAMAAPDARDPGAAGLGAAPSVDAERDPAAFVRQLDATRLRGKRLGIAREFFGLQRDADRQIERALEVLRAEGAELVDPVPVLQDAAALGAAEYTVLLYEFKSALNGYLSRRFAPGQGPRSLADLIDFNRRHAQRELLLFGQEHFLAAQAKGPLHEAAYRQALARCRQGARARGIDAALRRHRLDAIVAPTTAPAYLIDPVHGDHFLGACSQPAAVAGYPHVTVPAGAVFGLPVGLSFFGGAWRDLDLLGLAHAFERAAPWRPEPALQPHAAASP